VSKYEPLGQFLRKQKRNRIAMTFADIEKIIGAKLPKSKMNRAFWSNNPDNNVMTREWVKVGFETGDVDTRKGELVFRKKAKLSKTSKSGTSTPWKNIYGCMKGMISFAPGFDATSPAFTAEEWDEIEREWERNWDELLPR
jgi:hypothetical protein